MSSLRRLVVFGDSFVQGYSIQGSIENVTPFNMCHFLEKELGVEVINCGLRGSSNLAIANKVFRYIQYNDMTDTSILVVWSDTARAMELNHQYITDDTLMNFDYTDYIVGGTHEFDNRRLTLQEYRNVAALRLNSETAYHSVRMICQDYNVPVLMTNSFDNTMFEQKVFFQREPRDINYIQGKMKACWIEPEHSSNTLLDIIIGEWLVEVDNKPMWLPQRIQRVKHITRENSSKYPNITMCIHPTDLGNALIAKTIAPYILPIL